MSSILDRVLSAKHAEEILHFVPKEILGRILLPLSSRDRDICVRRFGLEGGDTVTLEEIGKSLEVTRERVRQIEHSVIKKIRAQQNFASIVAIVERVIRQYLEEAGGALAEEELYRRLLEGHDRPRETRAILVFFLCELLADHFQHIVESETVHSGWALRHFPLADLQKNLSVISALLAEKNTPLPESELLTLYRARNAGTTIFDEQLHSILLLSRGIAQNIFGDWGLSEWPTVHPRRMKDKIYLVLQRHGKPIHFNAITQMVNDAQFDQKIAYPPTIHNELIMDDRFVLVGRGTYALAAWGYKRGVVADVVADVLRTAGKPLDRTAIVRAVLTQRLVGKATVYLSLTDRNRFAKLSDGTYTLASS